MKNIDILSISQKKENNLIYVIYSIKKDNKKYELKYVIDGRNTNISFPVTEKIDGVVVSILIHAMTYGYDITSKYAISESLYYQLLNHVIPQIKKCNPNLSEVKIKAPISKEIYEGNRVATGISCGIDSLTTIYEYTDLCELEDYKLTNLVYFKSGAHDGQLGKFDSKVEDDLFNSQLKKAISFSEKINLSLIVVESNLNEFLTKAFEFTNYDRTHTFRNVGIMLLLSKDFSKYYYSDTYSLDSFSLDTTKDCAHYEKWLLPLLSNGSINCYSANKSMSRFEKTSLITNFKESYDNLLVCWHDGDNCGKCDKCIRTLVTLDSIGKLELYKKSFNIDEYKNNREKYFEKIILNKDIDPFFADIYDHASEFLNNNISNKRKLIIKLKKIARKIRK